MKRLFDIIVSLLALVVLSPALFVCAIWIATVMGRPILFQQARPGLKGRPFVMFKFRTMTSATNSEGALLPDAQRLGKLGRFLRASSLDELPELINVLRGEMSLVGPRPLLMQYLDRYTPEQRRRHEVRPGVTGWAQVNGRNALSWEEKFALDVWYVDNRTFLLDLKIIFLTLAKLVCPEGIAAAGEATMPEFLGSGKTGERHDH